MPSVRHVLYSFDGPKMVLAVDERGRQLVGVVADEDEAGTTRWLFAPAPAERTLSLIRTRAGLRGLFEGGVVELYDVGDEWKATRSWSLSPDDLPEALLPEPDAELPELDDAVRDLLVAEQQRLVERRI